MRVDVSEVMALARDIEQNAAQVPTQARTVIHKVGYDTLATMQAGTPIDTGNLKNSEGIDFTDDGLGFEVGPTAEYGGYVEEGTSRMHAEPYAGPAADREFPNVDEGLAAIGEQAIGRG